MATKNQHFVPRVYLKAWETKVETKKEPQKQFDGVYYFEKGDTVGEGATRETILWEPHLYTISFRQLSFLRHILMQVVLLHLTIRHFNIYLMLKQPI